MTKVAPIPIYGKKTLKIFQNQMADITETCIQHRALGNYQVCSNNDPRLAFDLFL